MIGRVTLKRTVKKATGWAAVLSQFFERTGTHPGAVFYYHRITDLQFVDSRIDDWNVSPVQFERQITTLSQIAEIVRLSELRSRLADPAPIDKPLVSLTFDDGYANFYSQVLPILQRNQIPATAFVVTSAIGSLAPMPFDHWARQNARRVPQDSWRPLNWHELEKCVATGLVTVGAHSHSHVRGGGLTRNQLADEVGRSREILRSRLGKEHSTAYAYPYGNTKLGDVSPEYITSVKEAGYDLAVTTDLGLVDADTNQWSIPRLEAHMLDAPCVMKAKTMGALLPYRIMDHFRGAYRA